MNVRYTFLSFVFPDYYTIIYIYNYTIYYIYIYLYVFTTNNILEI